MATEISEALLVMMLVTGAWIVTRKDLFWLLSTYRTQSTILSLIAATQYLEDKNILLLHLALLTFISKAVMIPYAIKKAKSKMQTPRDLVFHYSSPNQSIVTSMVLILTTYVTFSRVFSTLYLERLSFLGVVFGVSLSLMGFLVTFSRKRVITKILGYLTMENGVVLFSLFIAEIPFMIELLIAIDLLILVLLATFLAVGLDAGVEEFQNRLHPFCKTKEVETE